MKLVFIVALIAFLKATLLYRIYHRLPLVELKRRARAGNTNAAAIYKVAAAERPLDVLLFLLGYAGAAVVLIMSARVGWWAAVLATLIMGWVLLLAPRPRVGGWLWNLCAKTSPYTFKVLSWLLPVLNFIAVLVPFRSQGHTGAYEREDLLHLLDSQAAQTDSRINPEELKIAIGALTFGDKKVAKAMTPRRKVKFVSENDVLGPMLMDELHKTGFSRFPVVNGSAKANMPSVVGTLFLKDVTEVGQEDKGKVKDHMQRGAFFINEACNLIQALDAILKSHHHQLVVVNNFEEMVGVLTLEDVVEQILGQPIVDEFDKYDNLRAVANIEAEHEKAAHKLQEVEAEAPAEEPVEQSVAPAQE